MPWRSASPRSESGVGPRHGRATQLAQPVWKARPNRPYLARFVQGSNEEGVPAMPASITSLRRSHCKVTGYDLTTGYSFSVDSGGTLADTLKRTTRFYLRLTEDPPDSGHDPVTNAEVDFGDQGPGPVRSLGEVQQWTEALNVKVLLPRDEFEAFWRNMHIPEALLVIAWTEGHEVVQFFWFGSRRLAPAEDPRRRVDGLQRELSGDTGSY